MKILARELNTIQTQNDYRQVVWFYNLWSKLTESKAAQKVIEYSDIKDNEQILEVACGTGLVFKELLNKNPNGRNIGIDLSIDMLSKAKQLISRENAQNYELIQGDVLHMTFEDHSFDKLINNFMIDLMPEDSFDQILTEFHRVLKPNGVAVISVFSEGEKRINKIWGFVAKHFPKLLTNCRPVEIREKIMAVGFEIDKEIEISQNSFPSKVYRLIKRNPAN